MYTRIYFHILCVVYFFFLLFVPLLTIEPNGGNIIWVFNFVFIRTLYVCMYVCMLPEKPVLPLHYYSCGFRNTLAFIYDKYRQL